MGLGNYIIKSLKMDQEVLEARARLAARYGAPTQIGGKGKSALSPTPPLSRRISHFSF
jgi:hypothetical protein